MTCNDKDQAPPGRDRRLACKQSLGRKLLFWGRILSLNRRQSLRLWQLKELRQRNPCGMLLSWTVRGPLTKNRGTVSVKVLKIGEK